MKSLFVFVALLCLIQFSKADTRTLSGTNPGGESGNVRTKTTRDTATAKIAKPAYPDIYRNNIFKKRLDSIQKDVPLDYNEFVQAEISNYLSLKGDISREIGLSKYYFPIYEKAFHDAGIPDEIKYLSIVESQLNPYAVSRVGATGPWQFMSTTARIYGLTMDSYTDERRDPIQSSNAAAAYLKDAYEQFGDWLLAIASYNCGKSNVMHAIELAGSNDFWAIRQYLPAETRGYVPCYIAITYVMNYYKRYHIIPQQCNFPMKTDTVSVDKIISLNSVSRVLSVDMAQLEILNPSYTQKIVNGSADAPKVLVIPESAKEKYNVLYNNLNSDVSNTGISELDNNAYDNDQHVEKRVPLHRRVRKFETLANGNQSVRTTIKNNKG